MMKLAMFSTPHLFRSHAPTHATPSPQRRHKKQCNSSSFKPLNLVASKALLLLPPLLPLLVGSLILGKKVRRTSLQGQGSGHSFRRRFHPRFLLPSFITGIVSFLVPSYLCCIHFISVVVSVVMQHLQKEVVGRQSTTSSSELLSSIHTISCHTDRI